MSEKTDKEISNMSEKIGSEQLNEVSGGGGKNIGGRCKHYKCKECGSTAVHYQYGTFGLKCTSVQVQHAENCKYYAPYLKEGTCSNCAYNIGEWDCAIPND